MVAQRCWYPTVSGEGILNGNRLLRIKNSDEISIMRPAPRHRSFTADSDTPYSSATINLAGGSVVIEIPPGPLTGLVNDHNRNCVLGLGLAEPHAGNGGKHLVVPSGICERGPLPAIALDTLNLKNLIAIHGLPAG
jgi:hypothetical protein